MKRFPSIKKICEWLLYGYIFLLPWQTRLIWHEAWLNGYAWEYGRFSLYGTQLVVWSLIILFFLFQIFTQRKCMLSFLITRLKEPAVIGYWVAVLFILYCGVSIFWALDPSIAHYRWFGLLQAGALMAVVVNLSFDFKKICYAFVASGLVQAILSIAQFCIQAVYGNKWLGLADHIPSIFGSIVLQTDSERWLRVYGSLPHPNVLAGFLVVALLAAVHLSLRAVTRKEQWLILGAIMMLVSALFFTFSRSAWVATSVALLLILFFHQSNERKKIAKTYLMISFVVLFLTVNLFNLLASRVAIDEQLEISSITQRWEYTRHAYQLIATAPVQGWGIGNYTLAVFQHINPLWPGYYYQPVHTIYLLIASEIGMIGSILFSVLILFLLYSGMRRMSDENVLFLLVMMISFLIIGLFDHYFWTLEFGVMLFWLIMALNIKYLKSGK